MINFVWWPGNKLPAGTGGSENYTIGQVRELIRRGIAAQIITIGLGSDDGRDEFLDIPFKSLAREEDIQNLKGTVVFVNGASKVPTKQPAFILMHVPELLSKIPWLEAAKTADNCTLITTSKFAAKTWSKLAHRPLANIHIVYPFAEPCFSIQARKPKTDKKVRILFAGRLIAEKGIYTLLAAMHLELLDQNPNLVFSVTTAGSDKPEGKIILAMLKANPHINVYPARKTPVAMAELMTEQDIIVMPSNSQYWHETFGIVSIEGQHSGCWVVASNDGGLPETDCGGVILVKPDDAHALAEGIVAAIAKGPLPDAIRRKAANLFTVEQSVDNLLKVLFPAEDLVVQPIDKIILKSSIKARKQP